MTDEEMEESIRAIALGAKAMQPPAPMTDRERDQLIFEGRNPPPRKFTPRVIEGDKKA